MYGTSTNCIRYSTVVLILFVYGALLMYEYYLNMALNCCTSTICIWCSTIVLPPFIYAGTVVLVLFVYGALLLY